MAKENFVAFRADGDFRAYLKDLARILSVQEGRPVRVTDVIWRLIDRGMPLLEEELDQKLCTESDAMLHKKFEISAALRSTRSSLYFLERAVSPT